MRLSILHKIFLSVAAAMLIVVVVVLGLTRWSFNQGFVDYVNAFEATRLDAVVTDLAETWRTTGSFDLLLTEEWRWRALLDEFTGRSDDTHRNTPPPQRPPREVRRSGGGRGAGRPPAIELLDANGNVLIGRSLPRNDSKTRPIEVDGATVGYLRYVPITAITELDEDADREFVAQQRRAVYAIAVLALTIAGVLAIILARQLVAPIRALATGAKAITAGRLDQRIDVVANDELGQLAADFNAMAETLERSRESQRQWIVDIAHELRTPLAILGGELQAFEDGVRIWDDEARASLQAEVERLVGLVDDLRELTRSDAGGIDFRHEIVDLRDVTERALSRCARRITDRSLMCESNLSEAAALVRGDRNRLEQFVVNLIENSCRYTDPGGKLRVRLTDYPTAGRVHLVIEDSAPAVPTDALPLLFDRLYRVDESRSRESGGSGLGLAICKGIVEAHGGKIAASPSALGGLRIEVELPHERG